MIKVRMGLPSTTGSLPHIAFKLAAPVLVSANSLWVADRKRFRNPGSAIIDLDVALDSAGFVAINLYGGYRWSVEQYVELAGLHSWAWWAQMDLCCEPELDGDIITRLWANAWLLAYCRKVAITWRNAGADWLKDPMPILQGWMPDDYKLCVDHYDKVLQGDWPELVGIGSICRRNLHGDNGVLNIVKTLEQACPRHVNFHLFGVKGQVLKYLEKHPRVISTDSCAWDFRARIDAREKRTSCTIEHRAAHMRRWYCKQTLEK